MRSDNEHKFETKFEIHFVDHPKQSAADPMDKYDCPNSHENEKNEKKVITNSNETTTKQKTPFYLSFLC